MKSVRSFFGAAILCAFSLTYPLGGQAPQDRSATPQSRPAPGGQQGGNAGRPSRPDNGRPNPGGGNNGGPQVQPVRPNPGGQPPPRPNPGNGNNRPPVRPNPGNGNNRPNPGNRPPHRPSRPPQWGHRPPNRPSYSFRPNDRSYLHRYYLSRLGRINRGRRIHVVIGGYFPYGNIPYLSPLPPDIYGYLPPPPPGYRMGYYEGYVVVYDPVTYFIANVIDLLQ